MSRVFSLKTAFMTPLIKLILKHPQLMESKIFLKAMLIFPEKISKSYDSKVVNSDVNYQTAIEHGLSLVGNKPQKILDLCTGTGFAAIMALKHFPDAYVIGVDQSTTMIEIARSKVDSVDAGRMKFDFGNAAKLGYEDETFDLVITSNAPVYLAEVSRVLRHGGDIIVAYSFGGKAFLNLEYEVATLLSNYNLRLINLNNIGNGVKKEKTRDLLEKKKRKKWVQGVKWRYLLMR